MNILAVDTSAKSASCAILKDDLLVAEFFLNAGLTHSQTIMPLVQRALEMADMSAADIDIFAVSSGPGSFTGLRIGVSAVKGLAFSLNKPCAAVSTLAALALNAAAFDGIVVPAMDARREQVYSALFQNTRGSSARLCEDEAISICELYDKIKDLKEPVMLVGDGAELCFARLGDKLSGLLLAPKTLLHQRASSVAIAAAMTDAKRLVSAGELAPRYLRLPQAERERMEKSND